MNKRIGSLVGIFLATIVAAAGPSAESSGISIPAQGNASNNPDIFFTPSQSQYTQFVNMCNDNKQDDAAHTRACVSAGVMYLQLNPYAAYAYGDEIRSLASSIREYSNDNDQQKFMTTLAQAMGAMNQKVPYLDRTYMGYGVSVVISELGHLAGSKMQNPTYRFGTGPSLLAYD